MKLGDTHIPSSPLRFHVPGGDGSSDAKVLPDNLGPAGARPEPASLTTGAALINPNPSRRQEELEVPGGGEAMLQELVGPGGGEALRRELEAARSAGLPLAARLLERELGLAGAGPERLVGEARRLLGGPWSCWGRAAASLPRSPKEHRVPPYTTSFGDNKCCYTASFATGCCLVVVVGHPGQGNNEGHPPDGQWPGTSRTQPGT